MESKGEKRQVRVKGKGNWEDKICVKQTGKKVVKGESFFTFEPKYRIVKGFEKVNTRM